MKTGRPNLLFVFADQMRGQALGCEGAPVATPTFDRLATEGVRFARAYANCPVCTPSRGTLLTGRYAHQHRALANDLPLPVDEVSFASPLAQAGYRTGYVGKWHLAGVPRDTFTPPGERRFGFEDWAAWNCHHGYFSGRVYRDTPEPQPVDGYEPTGQTDIAIEFINKAGSQPWAVVLSWGPPHNPYDQVPDEYLAEVAERDLALRPNVPEDKADEARRDLLGYYAHVAALDAEMGRLMAALRDRGLDEDTLVVFSSDHGDMLFSQGLTRKQWPYEESIRVPLLMRWPAGLPRGLVAEGLVSTVDIAPTMLGLLGVDVPETMAGTDWSDLARGEAARGDEAVLLQEIVTVDEGWRAGLREWRGLRTGRYTFARYQTGEPWALFDTVEDPYQQRNLAAAPEAAEVIARLSGELDERLEAVGDPCLPREETLRSLGLVDLWNARERALWRDKARLLAATE